MELDGVVDRSCDAAYDRQVRLRLAALQGDGCLVAHMPPGWNARSHYDRLRLDDPTFDEF